MARSYRLMLFVAMELIFFNCPVICNGEGYRGFTKLNPNKCLPADTAVMSRLPGDWQKYRKYVKVCNLSSGKKRSDISIISIWTQEYFKQQYPPSVPPQWEQFPLPLVVDKDVHKLGCLPEIFPDDDVTSSIVYYGKWVGTIPSEILVDVDNPAEGGDYYYSPLVYKQQDGTYHMSHKEITHGRRR